MPVEQREYCPACNKVTPSTLLQSEYGCTKVYCACCSHWIDTIFDDVEEEAKATNGERRWERSQDR